MLCWHICWNVLCWSTNTKFLALQMISDHSTSVLWSLAFHSCAVNAGFHTDYPRFTICPCRSLMQTVEPNIITYVVKEPLYVVEPGSLLQLIWPDLSVCFPLVQTLSTHHDHENTFNSIIEPPSVVDQPSPSWSSQESFSSFETSEDGPVYCIPMKVSGN